MINDSGQHTLCMRGERKRRKRQSANGELNENWNAIKHLDRITVAICHTPSNNMKSHVSY